MRLRFRAPSTRSAFLRDRAGLALALVAFGALIAPTIDQGVGSWDGRRVMQAIDALLYEHRIVASRPPGHPPTEFYLFGSLGWLRQQIFGHRFDERDFLIVTWGLSVLTAVVFFEWLVRTGRSAGRATLASVALLFSPQVIDLTLDGQEFIPELLLLLGAFLLLACGQHAPPGRRRMTASAILFAFATGCRPELLLSGFIIYPLWLWCWGERDWRTWAATFATVATMVVLVWLPQIISQGRLRPYGPEMTPSQAILAWGYKLLFVGFGFPTGLVLIAAFGLTTWRLRGVNPSPQIFGECAAVAHVLVYFGLFVILPNKVAYVLVTLPFLLWLAAGGPVAWIGAVAVLTVFNLVSGIDIFRDRRLTAPHFTAGSYQFSLSGKPLQQKAYIESLTGIPAETKTAVIGDVWSWVDDYHLDRATLPLERVALGRQGHGFAVKGEPLRLLVARESIEQSDLLARLRRAGYAIVRDRLLWRTLFARYDVTTDSPDEAMIGDIPVRLVTVGPAN